MDEEFPTITSSNFRKYIIASDFIETLESQEGWIALDNGEWIYLVYVWSDSHNRIEDILDDKKGGIHYNWRGTLRNLRRMINGKFDPDKCDCKIEPKNQGYKQLVGLYRELLLWSRNK
jgi:hypothetical protein